MNATTVYVSLTMARMLGSVNLWGANITSVLTRASASHPPELPGLDLPENMLPQGWPETLSESTIPRYGWSFATPQALTSSSPTWFRLHGLN